ncbi:hypothetical protein IQ37_18805 [Chryseobacterium piperi]|uniref:Uncharacterized protein n=1 Tax=Chryseobacterium piperi TaxID=558152 RepID=A0A086AE93_9FLAO|nr:hypothetical protein [Chryseobacterium piperi]ASW75237.1 hypothetical protein CJF12_13710 [Chryseobacterium piperi]KFF15007.1 hypothetical protein IQ37_18805 [Chryseobacterium piperi]
MRKKANSILMFLLLISSASCSRDEVNSGNEDMGNLNYNDVKKVEMTEAEMLQKGWKVVDEFKLTSQPLNANNNLINGEKRLPFKAGYLKDMGYDIYSSGQRERLKNVFSYYGQIPDGITFSSDLSVDGDTRNTASNPDVSVVLGTPKINIETNGLDLPDDAYTTEAVNNSDRESEITVSYSYKKGYSTSWKRTVSGSFEVGATVSVDIPLVAKASASTKVVVGGDTTDGTESSEEITETSTYKAIVPAHSKKTIAILTKLKGSSVEYFVPMKLTGVLLANFSSPVNGHYYWAFPIESFPNFLSNIHGETGVAKSVSNVSVKVLESPAQKI